MNVRDCAVLNVYSGGTQITSVAATENSDAIDVSNFTELIVFLPVTAHAGTTPTLDCKIQYSPDKTNWVDSGDTFTQITTTDGTFFKKASSNFGKYIRLVFTLGGTGSPSYTVTPQIVAKS